MVIDEAFRDEAQPWMVEMIDLCSDDAPPHAFSEGGRRKKIRASHVLFGPVGLGFWLLGFV